METHEIKYKNIRELVEVKAEERRNNVYFAYYEREITFGEFNDRTSRIANALLKLGIKKGDIVYIYMHNSPEFLMAALAAHKICAIAGPINNWLKGEEIKYQFNDSKGKAVVVDTDFAPVVAEIRKDCPALKFVIENSETPSGDNLSLPKLIAENSPDVPPVEIKGSDLAFIFYTAGTTGNPKGALLTHWNVMFEVAAIRSVLETPDDTPDNAVALIFLPMFHVNAMMTLLASMYRGIKTALLKKFSVREFGPTVEKHKCNFFSAVPKVYKILIQARDTVQKNDLSSLKFGICGAAPMPVETINQFEKLYGVEILEGYGLTEGTVASTLHRRGGVKKIGSIGPALPGQEVKIFDENDNELPPGEVGEIVVRGENVMVGYLGLDEANRKTLRGGWLHTGDLGFVDKDGFFFIKDREKDMIIKGGENIYPKEIENAISTHPAVHDVAVIGVPDEMSGEEVKAFVVPKIGETVTEEEIISHCNRHLADFKVPKSVEFVIGLPSSAVGKSLKRLLRDGTGITRLTDVEGGEPLNLDAIFQMMPMRFKPEKAGAWEARIQYNIYGASGGTWTIDVSDGKMETKKGEAEEPSCIVKLYDQTFKKLVLREIDPVSALNSGLMQIVGNEADVAMLGEVMG
ncbi:MAG: long-chain-fatty-acid--CoA ligase [bacterium]